MSDIDFYEIVDVLASPDAMALEVSNSRGIIVGISNEPDGKRYAVLIGNRTFMLDASDLVRTGERVDRETIYGGETIQVRPERYSDDGPHPLGR